MVFSQRLIRPELLDHVSAEEARPNLADLVRINRFLGGHSTIRKLLSTAVSRDEKFTVLDIGAASGDTARYIADLYPHASVTSLDYNLTNLEAAPFPKLIADAFSLPFGERSFDFVMSSLFLHHFTDEQVVALLRSFHGAARRGLLIADLERHVLPYLFLKLSKPFFGWGRITVHDGLISVRAAFRKGELQGLAKSAGIQNAKLESHRPAFRLTLSSVKG
ncbi:MAG: methyltransferase domain-containing protein [Acidobacteriota bacterium]|nr:methyltransferase domain-containing protein [Acidobacteriota bacterium]